MPCGKPHCAHALHGSGRALDGIGHLRQSILDILTTHPGKCIMRPEHGSRLRELIDRPIDAQLLADFYFEVTMAIQRWESRVRVQHVAARMDTRDMSGWTWR